MISNDGIILVNGQDSNITEAVVMMVSAMIDGALIPAETEESPWKIC